MFPPNVCRISAVQRLPGPKNVQTVCWAHWEIYKHSNIQTFGNVCWWGPLVFTKVCKRLNGQTFGKRLQFFLYFMLNPLSKHLQTFAKKTFANGILAQFSKRSQNVLNAFQFSVLTFATIYRLETSSRRPSDSGSFTSREV